MPQVDTGDRLRKLEKLVELHGTLIPVCLIASVVLGGFSAAIFMEKGTPDYDHIAVSLTVFQTLFGLAAVYGFWSLRGLTREKAEEVAEAEVKKIAGPIIRRHVQESLEKMLRRGQIPAEAATGMLESLTDGKEDEDD